MSKTTDYIRLNQKIIDFVKENGFPSTDKNFISISLDGFRVTVERDDWDE